jgi:hypothetical protein
MASLSDKSFNVQAYGRMIAVAVALLAVLAGIGWVILWYQGNVESERLLRARFDDPTGQAGLSTNRVSALGERAVPVLMEDLRAADPERRYKAMELLGSIEDPRVVPALGGLVADQDISVRLNGVAALARTARPEAVDKLWPLTKSPEDLERMRAIVALGLVAGKEQFDKLEAAVVAAQGVEKSLYAWSLGHAQRRQDSVAAGSKGYITAAPPPVDDADEQRIQTRIDELNAQLAAGKDIRAAAKELATLTTVDMNTWDLGHQISLQVLAVRGPRQWRGARTADPPPEPTGVQLKGEGRARPDQQP